MQTNSNRKKEDISRKILSDITVYSKYARYLPEQKRRETWEEIVLRNATMHCKKFPKLEDEIMSTYGQVLDKKVLPSMRSLQFGGKPIEISPNRLFNCAYMPIDDVAAFSETMFLLLGGTGVGYALSLDTPIMTTKGWKLMRDISLWDQVFGPDGKPTNVCDVSPIYKDHEVYEIEFSNGQILKADAGHLWTIQSRGQRNTTGYHSGNNTKTVKTEDLNIGDSIWVTKPLDLQNKDLVLDPYVLGYWLGDGTTTNSSISTSDIFIIEEFNRLGYPTTHIRRYDYVVKGGLGKGLKQLGLQRRWTDAVSKKRRSWGQKRIPEEYMYSSIEQRLSLLQGLMDSDGTCTKKGQCVFSVKSEVLARDVLELCCSLGLNPTLNTRICGTINMWAVSFTTNQPVFRLPRKLERLCAHTLQSDRIFIRNIQKILSEPVRCITVDNASHLYLAGQMMIPTHNSVQKHHVEKLPEVIGPKRRRRRYLIGDSIEGWADAIKVLVESYFYNKSIPDFDYRDIRPKGANLITSGGKAPGPQPLKDCVHNVRKVFDGALESRGTGTQLKTLEVHDIICYIADAVLAGGIRRAALISLFSFDDQEMLTSKFGNWWELYPQRARANNSAVALRHRIKEKDFFEFWSKVKASGSGEPGIYFTNDKEWGANPCVEIALRPCQFCNLTTVNVSDVEDQEDLNRRVRAAAFIGTLQASYTDFHYLRDTWQSTTEKEGLIGVSMTGIASGNILKLNLKEAANVVKEENKRVAKLLGIKSAARTTCIKPEGTASLVAGTSSGIHAWHAPYYIRRMRLGKNEPIHNYLKYAIPELLEDEMMKPDLESVLSVPVKAPERAIFRDETALDLLERGRRFSTEWVKGGHISGSNHHNVSITVSVKDHEWDSVGRWMWEHRSDYNGIAVLPYDGGSYIQAPFEDCSEEMYESMLEKCRNIDLTKVREDEDNTQLKENVACSGGNCTITHVGA